MAHAADGKLQAPTTHIPLAIIENESRTHRPKVNASGVAHAGVQWIELLASNMLPSRRDIMKERRRLSGALFSTAVLTATIALCSWAIPQSAPAAAKADDSNSAPQVVFRKLVRPVIESGMIALYGGDVVL